MAEYQQILVSVDLSQEATQVMQRAISMAQANGAALSVVHVIEPLTFAYGGDIPMDLSEVQDQLRQQAKEHLNNLSASANIPPERQHILVGQPATEIHQLATTENIDLIILGSHGRRGLALLLGSTANAVLHGASCDVLAVRVNDEDPDAG